MKPLILFATAMLMASVVHAQSAVPVPPKKFDRPYNGKLEVIVDPTKTVKCRRKGSACQWVAQVRRQQWFVGFPFGSCKIIIPAGLHKADRDAIVRNQRAQCNGWNPRYAATR